MFVCNATLFCVSVVRMSDGGIVGTSAAWCYWFHRLHYEIYRSPDACSLCFSYFTFYG